MNKGVRPPIPTRLGEAEYLIGAQIEKAGFIAFLTPRKGAFENQADD